MSDNGTVDVAVIVVTYESEAVLGGLLASLPDALSGCTWRAVIVDNDSSDSTVELARSTAPEALVVQTGRNAGYAAGVNAGVRNAGAATSVLVLNPDVRLAPGSVRLMLECMQARDAGIVVPRVTDSDGALVYTLRREPNIRRSLGDALLGSRRAGLRPHWGETVTRERVYESETTAAWATGAVLLMSRLCLEACGPWDESFFLYSEETEFCLRARDLGWDLMFLPSAGAVHLGGDSRVSPELRALLLTNRVRLYGRSHSAVASALFWLVAVTREVSRLPLRRPTSRAALRTLLSPRGMREASLRAQRRTVKDARPVAKRAGQSDD